MKSESPRVHEILKAFYRVCSWRRWTMNNARVSSPLSRWLNFFEFKWVCVKRMKSVRRDESRLNMHCSVVFCRPMMIVFQVWKRYKFIFLPSKERFHKTRATEDFEFELNLRKVFTHSWKSKLFTTATANSPK